MRNNSGFTLIELAVIIAIVGVLAGIAVPSFVGWLPKYRLSSSADDIQALVQNARLRAVKENAHVAVLFDPDNDGLDGDYLVFVDQNSNWSKDANEALVAHGEVATGIRITGTSGYANARFSFNSRGLCSDDSGIIKGGIVTLRNSKGKTKTVNIEMTGSSRIN
jgi:prepilin-type N-terminal cleavage/methylation domain-containing protein